MTDIEVVNIVAQRPKNIKIGKISSEIGIIFSKIGIIFSKIGKISTEIGIIFTKIVKISTEIGIIFTNIGKSGQSDDVKKYVQIQHWKYMWWSVKDIIMPEKYYYMIVFCTLLPTCY